MYKYDTFVQSAGISMMVVLRIDVLNTMNKEEQRVTMNLLHYKQS